MKTLPHHWSDVPGTAPACVFCRTKRSPEAEDEVCPRRPDQGMPAPWPECAHEVMNPVEADGLSYKCVKCGIEMTRMELADWMRVSRMETAEVDGYKRPLTPDEARMLRLQEEFRQVAYTALPDGPVRAAAIQHSHEASMWVEIVPRGKF